MIFRPFLLILLMVSFLSFQVRAKVDPRVKTLGTMAGYGTVGGALLGTASLAFGSSGRSVARGASLGLYFGLLFGGYIVLSHAYKRQQRMKSQSGENYYPGVRGPYEETSRPGKRINSDAGYYVQGVRELYSDSLESIDFSLGSSSLGKASSLKGPAKFLNFYIPLFNFSF